MWYERLEKGLKKTPHIHLLTDQPTIIRTLGEHNLPGAGKYRSQNRPIFVMQFKEGGGTVMQSDVQSVRATAHYELLHISLPTGGGSFWRLTRRRGRGAPREANAKLAQQCAARALMWCLQ